MALKAKIIAKGIIKIKLLSFSEYENRFNNIKLNENAPPKVSEKTYSIVKQNFANPQDIDSDNLLIFENNLSFEITDFNDFEFKKIYLV